MKPFRHWFSLLSALLLSLSGCAQNRFENQDVQAFAKTIGSADVQLLDVRTPAEYAAGHIAGAMLIDIKADGFMEQAASRLTTDRPVAVYCRSGRRSAEAARRLADAGYRVVNLLGGIEAWRQSQPVER